MKLFISPHNDDETLFGAFTLMREKPLVVIVTDSFIQQNRGEAITPQDRFQETVDAMKILGLPVVRLGIRDDIITELAVIERLAWFKNFETIYGPALQGGNPAHDIVAAACEKVFKSHPGASFFQYATYSKESLTPVGTKEIIPTPEELELKEKMIACYKTQLELPATLPHFEAVKGKSEWLI